MPNDNEVFSTGAQRGKKEHTNYHSISPVGLRRLAETHFEGDTRYGPHNWEKGMPISGLLNHSIAHIFKYLNGDIGEDHLAHATWGLMAAMDMEENHPDLDHGLRPEKSKDIKIQTYSNYKEAREDFLQESVLPLLKEMERSSSNGPDILAKITDSRAKLPYKSYEGDAGYDLFMLDDISIKPKQSIDVQLGYNIKIPNGYWGSIKARSSTVTEVGLVIMEGVIDSNYTGPMSIVITNPTGMDIEITAGQRLAQLILIPTYEHNIEKVKNMPFTNRGKRGFGSTGV